MLVDATLSPSLDNVAAEAAAAERSGFDGLWVAEVAHDPFLPLGIAAEHTRRITLGTSIVVAFGRSPLTLAASANELHRYSGGRFVLGLGSQIKPHIEKRFSMPWSEPPARMRELILAVRAIWESWNEHEPLRFQGRFYTHTLMTPFFSQEPNPHGPPPIYLAAVGPLMTAVAAEVADGLFIHPFTTQRYLREVTMPAVESALAAAGRRRQDFTLTLPALVVTGADEDAMAAAAAAVRLQLAFYASTPAYRPVLEVHGWEGVQPDLNRRSKAGDWVEMATLVDDEMLHTLAVVARPDDLGAAIRERFGGIVDRFGFSTLGEHRLAPEVLAPVVRNLQERASI